MTRAPLVPPHLLDAPRNPWNLVVEGLLATLLTFSPLAFGAVDAWSELVVIGLAAVMSLVVVLRAVVDRTFRLPWTWTYVPLAAFIALVVLQLTPLSAGGLATLSPESAELRAELLGAADAVRADATISMYPLATAHGLRMLMVGAAVYFVVASTVVAPSQVKRLLLAITVIGAAEAALALLQIVTHAGGLYWTVDAGTNRITSGSFVNYSNFSQFMNLALGAGLALLLIRLHEDRRATGVGDDDARPFGGASLADHGALLGALLLCALAVLASLSRNGAMAMLVASALVAAGLYRRGTLGRRGWVLAVLPVAALAVLLAFGFDVVYQRLATLQQRDEFGSRWQLSLDVLRAWRDFPVWGAGLGTHEFVFPMYDSSGAPQLAAHADNDYAQLLEETGIVGAACVAAFLAVIIGCVLQLGRNARLPASAAAFGLAFGLLAVAIHSASDFGQRLPAVFCLSAVVCALAVQLHRMERMQTPISLSRRGGLARRLAALAALAALALAWAWALRAAYAAHLGEQWWAAAYQLDESIAQAPGEVRDSDYADLLAATSEAVRSEPRNVEYAYSLNLFRWRALTRDVDAATGAILLPMEARPVVARIADELAAVRRLCPTYGPPYALEGQLRLLVFGDERGAGLIRQGLRLAPYDAPTWLIAGEVAARAGRADDAVRLLQGAVERAPGFFPTAAALLLVDLKLPTDARALAGDDFARLELLADLAAAHDDLAPLAAELRGAAEAVLRRRALDDRCPPGDLAVLAAIDAQRGDLDSAITLYDRALTDDYSQVEWRLARAQALAALGRNDEALHEARICLRFSPNHAAARALIAELSVRTTAD